jgi:hypothetical protein
MIRKSLMISEMEVWMSLVGTVGFRSMLFTATYCKKRFIHGGSVPSEN